MMYEVGDIVFFLAIPTKKKTWYFRTFTKLQSIFDGKYSHTEVIVGFNEITKVATTLGVNGDGLKYREVDMTRDDIDVGRYKGGLNQKKALYVLETMYESKKEEGSLGYSWLGLFDAGINAVLDKVSFGKWRKRNIFKDEKKDFCSEFATTFLERVTGEKLINKQGKVIDESVASPSELSESKSIIMIKKGRS